MSSGWIKVHRSMLEWEWFKDSETLHLFLYFLLSANHEDGKFEGVEVKRGELITGLSSISKNTGISTQTIRTSIKRLISTGEVTRKSTNRFSIIKITNYDSYQQLEPPPNKLSNKQTNKQPTSNQQATNKQLTTNKNDKNIRNKESISSDSSVRFPPSLDTEEIKSHFEKFKAHHREKYKLNMSKAQQQAVLDEWDGKPKELLAAIKLSIRNGWKNIYAGSDYPKNGTPTPKAETKKERQLKLLERLGREADDEAGNFRTPSKDYGEIPEF